MDTVAVNAAKNNHFQWREFLPDYEKHGSPAALFMRNKEIVTHEKMNNGVLFAFALADEAGKITSGTNDSWKYAQRINCPAILFRVDKFTNKWLSPIPNEALFSEEVGKKILDGSVIHVSIDGVPVSYAFELFLPEECRHVEGVFELGPLTKKGPQRYAVVASYGTAELVKRAINDFSKYMKGSEVSILP